MQQYTVVFMYIGGGNAMSNSTWLHSDNPGLFALTAVQQKVPQHAKRVAYSCFSPFQHMPD